MHPLDTIKVFQQSSPVNVGILAAFHAVWRSGGLKALYKGVVPYLIADGSSGAVRLATFELSKNYLEKRIPVKFHAWGRFLCAAFSMFVCSFILVPGEVLKVRLQSVGVAAHTNLMGVISTIMKQDGIKGFFVGYGATLLRDVPYTALELGIYENLKIFLKRRRARPNEKGCVYELTQSDESLSAAVTGMVVALVTTPLDLVKTRLMLPGSTLGVLGTLKS